MSEVTVVEVTGKCPLPQRSHVQGPPSAACDPDSCVWAAEFHLWLGPRVHASRALAEMRLPPPYGVPSEEYWTVTDPMITMEIIH